MLYFEDTEEERYHGLLFLLGKGITVVDKILLGLPPFVASSCKNAVKYMFLTQTSFSVTGTAACPDFDTNLNLVLLCYH